MACMASHNTACTGVPVRAERSGAITIIAIDRPHVRNAVDTQTADMLARAFEDFEADPHASVAILTGTGGTFCAGADLKELASGGAWRRWGDRATPPMGPTRSTVTKPVIAAIEGYAVGGGLELAIWCDLRVGGDGAVLGLFNRSRGLPTVDGGTFRLARLIGESRAMDMILTGRAVEAQEAHAIGLLNRLVPRGGALTAALELARSICTLPQPALRTDLSSAKKQWALPTEIALDCEFSEASALSENGPRVRV